MRVCCALLCVALAAGGCRRASGEPSQQAIDPRATPEQRELAAGDGAELRVAVVVEVK